ncbi:MAG: hypothetical protein OXH50_09985, partial [Gemmatimonadetes bacterium]|nr:hypothetical protein [Gemmatimonadota bacterium]
DIHPEFVADAEQLQPLTSLAVYHSGQVPAGGMVEELPADAAFTVDPPFDAESEKGVLWGFFGSAGETTHVLVVNLDHGREVATTVVGPGALEEFDPEAGQWRPAADGSRSQLDLVAGGGRLLRLQDAP